MQTAYNGGELSPFMLGRPDHEIWPVALAECVGWAPRPQGPLEACPGFEYVDTAAGKCRLLAFEPYSTQGYVIEASASKFRFYTNDARIETSPGVPYELASTYTIDQIGELWAEPSVDVLYLFHRNHRPRELARTSAVTFALANLALANGPYMDRNDDETLALSFDGVSGSVTVTATAALFAATDVGRLIEVETEDLSDIPSWEPGITTAMGDLVQWDGRVYQVVGVGATTPARTGTNSPTHSRGVEWDGIGTGTDINDAEAGGVQLLYLHDSFGRLTITAYTSPTEVTALVTRRLPLQLATTYSYEDYLPDYYIPGEGWVSGGSYTSPGSGSYTTGTWRWRLGAYSDTTGWPSAGLIFNQRLYLFRDDRIDASVAGSLNDFDRFNELGEISVDQAFSLVIDDPNPIRWAHKGDELFIGTSNAEYVLRKASAAAALGPGNIEFKRQSRKGSAGLRPIDGDGLPIFLQRAGRRLMQLTEDRVGRYVPEDLTRYADHIGNSPILELAWQNEPLQLLWAVRADGTLASAIYLPQESVLGWWRRPLAAGMLAESVCAITGPDGRTEQLWLSADRSGTRFVMKLGAWRSAGEQQDNPIMLDAALTYTGAATSVFTMPHLPGASVDVVGDGAWLGSYTVAGDGTLDVSPFAPTSAVAGLSFPAFFTVLPIEAGGDSGPAQSKMKRPSRVTLRVQNSLGLQVERGGAIIESIGNSYVGEVLDTAITPITKDVVLDIVGGWDRDGQFTVRRVSPFAATVLAHTAIVEASQR